MALAEAHPKPADNGLLAQVRFLQGEEADAAYLGLALRQPLGKSIPVKQRLLDATLSRYRQCVDLGDSEWAHAATYRIGQALVAFGQALDQSERPADLVGDDRKAYDAVLSGQSAAFYAKGEDVWTELLRQKGRAAPDETWIKQAQASLWERLGTRFHFETEVEFPLVAATPPVAPDTAAALPATKHRRPRHARRDDEPRAQEESR